MRPSASRPAAIFVGTMSSTRSVNIVREDSTLAMPSGEARGIHIPERLGPVKLIRRLGQGGMGVVWLGRHELLGRDVAVKFLLDIPRSEDDPNFAMFLQGARAAAAIQHQGLNQILHADVVEGVPYLVMEYIDGPSLSDALERSGPLTPAAARAVLGQMLGAIAELHDHELIHRDIKPANVMITRDGRVVVTDFGLACPRPAAAFGEKSGTLSGTPAYMAPEMFEGAASARSDVYAIGVTAYQLLSGALPFDGPLEQVRLMHKHEPADVEVLAKRGVPEAVVEAVERAMNKNVLFRPRSARNVLDAFEEAFKRAGVEAASSSELARLGATEPGAAAAPTPTPSGEYYTGLRTLASKKAKGELTPPAPLEVVPDPEPPRSGLVPDPPKQLVVEFRGFLRTLFAATTAGMLAAVAVQVVAMFVAAWVERRFGVVGAGVAEPQRGFLFALNDPPVGSELVAAVVLGLGVVMVTSAAGVYGAMRAYMRMRSALPRGLIGHCRCGWCGFELRGLSQAKCPKCLRAIGEAKKAPARGLWMDVVLAGVVFVLTVLAAHALADMAAPVEEGRRGLAVVVLRCVLPAWLGSLAAVLVLDAGEQRALAATGRVWCRECGGELKELKAPVCPGCGARI